MRMDRSYTDIARRPTRVTWKWKTKSPFLLRESNFKCLNVILSNMHFAIPCVLNTVCTLVKKMHSD